MSAETLRRAAALMRERAEAASPGPWMVDEDAPHIVLKPDKPGFSWDGTIIATVPEDFGLVDYADAEHIASATPEFVRAVGAWLAHYAAQVDESADRAPFGALAEDTLVADVARTYLGESS